MNKIITILIVLTTQVSVAQTKVDSLQVHDVVTQYINSFYLTQPDEGRLSVHEQLAKRTIIKSEGGNEILKNMTVEELESLSTVFNRSKRYGSNSKKEISILDMMNKTASVKLIAEGWVDYIHLGKLNGKWKIINVIWQYENN